MKFEYHTLDVKPFLKAKTQPVLAWEGMKPKNTYYVLQNPDDGQFGLATTNSQVARVPVFALASPTLYENSEVSSHSGFILLTAEVVLRFVAAMCPLGKAPTKAVVFVGTECHDVGDRYRGYFGLVLEVPN